MEEQMRKRKSSKKASSREPFGKGQGKTTKDKGKAKQANDECKEKTTGGKNRNPRGKLRAHAY